jgi:hypothetical protein
VFTARYALSPYIKQIRFVFEGLKLHDFTVLLCNYCSFFDIYFTLGLYIVFILVYHTLIAVAIGSYLPLKIWIQHIANWNKCIGLSGIQMTLFKL